MEGMSKLDKQEPYQGKWEIRQEINKERYERYLNEVFGPQFKDPSYIYRDVAGYFLSLGGYKAALKNASDGIKKGPFRLINYRTYFYILRRMLSNN